MKVLIVSHYFAPYQVMGAIRMSKLAKYWHERGQEVRVIAGNNQPFPRTLPLEIPVAQVYYSHWLYINGLERLASRKTRSANPPVSPSQTGPTLRQKATFYFKTLTNFPDGYIAWYPWALAQGRELLREWKPDFILASAPPNTGLMVASRLSQEFKIPWFADFRDLWMEDPHRAMPYGFPSWRTWLEEKLERSTLASSRGFITVSQPLAQTLRRKYPQAVEIVMNGFDPADYPNQPTTSNKHTLDVLYTGQLFEGGTDPSPLLIAMQAVNQGQPRVRLRFFAPPQMRQDPTRFELKFSAYRQYVLSLAAQHGVEQSVQVEPPVPFKESLQMQRNADVLLLMIRHSPDEQGTFTGKFFEYIGARRPILALGPSDNVAVSLVREQKMGLSSNHPSEISDWLTQLLQQKALAEIADIDNPQQQHFSREHQFGLLEKYIVSQLGL